MTGYTRKQAAAILRRAEEKLAEANMNRARPGSWLRYQIEIAHEQSNAEQSKQR